MAHYPSEIHGPNISVIKQAREILGDSVLKTPVWQCRSPVLKELLGPSFELWLKLELWQYSGSFKLRAALLSVESLTPEQKKQGIVALSAGNHAVAVAWAAKQYGIHAKVLMPKTASPVRISKCQALGAEVVLLNNMEEVFAQAELIQAAEGRQLIHPFNGEIVSLGTGTLAIEINEQIAELDYILTGVGGGGLISGLANAYKQLQPSCRIIGVEPIGSSVMKQSLAAGRPLSCSPKSIADSLCAPKTEWRPLVLCQRFVDKIVTVEDDAIAEAMRFLFHEMKLAVEPAGSIGIAAIMGPLREELANKKVCVIISGSNIDEQRYCQLIGKAE
jgi:threonine dehydratase